MGKSRLEAFSDGVLAIIITEKGASPPWLCSDKVMVTNWQQKLTCLKGFDILAHYVFFDSYIDT